MLGGGTRGSETWTWLFFIKTFYLLKVIYLISDEYWTSSLSLFLKMKAAKGMWSMSSVILSTWVITLSTLSRYLPKENLENLPSTFFSLCHLYLLWWQLCRHWEHSCHSSQEQVWFHSLVPHHPVSAISVVTILISGTFVQADGNLWPEKRSLIAIVEDEAGVHGVPPFNPGHWSFYKVQFFLLR